MLDVIAHLLRGGGGVIDPSVTAADGDSEGGAPTTPLEAQAIGTPIVTTRHADIPHVVPPGPGVWLCDEHDVAALADALIASARASNPLEPRPRQTASRHRSDRAAARIAIVCAAEGAFVRS